MVAVNKLLKTFAFTLTAVVLLSILSLTLDNQHKFNIISSVPQQFNFLKNTVRDFIINVISNLFSCATCSYGDTDCIVIPGKYCNGTAVFGNEIMIFPGTNGSIADRVYLRRIYVGVPNNYAYAIADFLRSKGLNVNIDKQHLYTVVIRVVKHSPVQERCGNNICTVIHRVPSDEAVVVVAVKNENGRIETFIGKVLGGRNVKILKVSKIRYVVVNQSLVEESKQDFSMEIASKLNITIEDVKKFGIPSETIKKLVVYYYKLDVNSLDKDLTTIEGFDISQAVYESSPGSVTYELRSQIATGPVVHAETILRFTAYWSPVIPEIVSVIDESECKCYLPPTTMIIADCSHRVGFTDDRVVGKAYGKYVFFVLHVPPIYITYCAGAEMEVDRYTGYILARNTRVCWWSGSPPYPSCETACPVYLYM